MNQNDEKNEKKDGGTIGAFYAGTSGSTFQFGNSRIDHNNNGQNCNYDHPIGHQMTPWTAHAYPQQYWQHGQGQQPQQQQQQQGVSQATPANPSMRPQQQQQRQQQQQGQHGPQGQQMHQQPNQPPVAQGYSPQLSQFAHQIAQHVLAHPLGQQFGYQMQSSQCNQSSAQQGHGFGNNNGFGQSQSMSMQSQNGGQFDMSNMSNNGSNYFGNSNSNSMISGVNNNQGIKNVGNFGNFGVPQDISAIPNKLFKDMKQGAPRPLLRDMIKFEKYIFDRHKNSQGDSPAIRAITNILVSNNVVYKTGDEKQAQGEIDYDQLGQSMKTQLLERVKAGVDIHNNYYGHYEKNFIFVQNGYVRDLTCSELFNPYSNTNCGTCPGDKAKIRLCYVVSMIKTSNLPHNNDYSAMFDLSSKYISWQQLKQDQEAFSNRLNGKTNSANNGKPNHTYQ